MADHWQDRVSFLFEFAFGGLNSTSSARYYLLSLLQDAVNSSLADSPLLWTALVIQIPGECYGGLTGNEYRYHGLSLLRTYGHFRGTKNDNFIVLALEKADTTYFSYNIIM